MAQGSLAQAQRAPRGKPSVLSPCIAERIEPDYEPPPKLELDLNVLRASLGEQAADLIRTSSEQSMGKLQGAWMERFEQLVDKVVALNICVQQLSNRCCYLEGKLQQLMNDERHKTETATATKVTGTSANGNARNELQQLAERHGSETASATMVTVTPACGNGKKKRTRRTRQGEGQA